MILAFDLPEIDTDLVVDSLRTLAKYNARTWDCVSARTAGCLAPPWGLKWSPDPKMGQVTLRDANRLMARGYGSCGELAAAYAGYMLATGMDATIHVEIRRPDEWHAWVTAGSMTLDPEKMGAR